MEHTPQVETCQQRSAISASAIISHDAASLATRGCSRCEGYATSRREETDDGP